MISAETPPGTSAAAGSRLRLGGRSPSGSASSPATKPESGGEQEADANGLCA